VSVTSIAEQVRAMRSELGDRPPSAFDREQQALAEETVTGVIAVGERLPNAELLNVHGEPTELLGELAGRRGVLVFYRGVWCPFCNIALHAYQTELLPALSDRAVALLAISPQRPDGSLSMREKHGLQFAVLSDRGNKLAEAAGILTAPSEDARAAQLELGLDLTHVNADGTVLLPMPTIAILEPDATVRWIDVHPDYSTRTETAEILAALDALQA
jgi:peroxiredoxin